MKQLFQWIDDLEGYCGYEKALKESKVLNNYFNVKHFWYFKLTDQGKYSYFGTHKDWNRHCIEHDLIKPCLNLRKKKLPASGIQFVASGADTEGKSILKNAWETYRIHFNVNLTSTTDKGVESFGFATGYKDPLMTERLINDAPLLKHFTQIFKKRHEKLFHHIDAYALDLPRLFKRDLSEIPHNTLSRDQLIESLGLKELLNTQLSPREAEILSHIVHGFSAPYIAKHLHLSKRTVENYLASLKQKLNVDTKSELILKAQKLQIIGKL